MSLFTILAAEGKVIDPARSIHWLWPADAELIYGSIASVVIFGALFKFAGPAVKKAMAARTERIQHELDQSAAARTTAESEAAEIRRAAGDIAAERSRMLADADAQAAALLADGRARLEQEIADLRIKAESDIAASAGRANDELRAEISRLAAVATEQVIAGAVLDDGTQQALIENFIAKVGAGS